MFYQCFFDDILISSCSSDVTDHLSVNCCSNSLITTKFHQEGNKLTTHWSSIIRKRYSKMPFTKIFVGLNVYRQASTTSKCSFLKNLITHASHNFSQIVSSETMSISKIKDKIKKMSTLCHLFFLKLEKKQYWWSFHIVPRMSSAIHEKFPLIHQPKVSSDYYVDHEENYPVCYAKFLKKRLFVSRHTSLKQFGILTFDRMTWGRTQGIWTC